MKYKYIVTLALFLFTKTLFAQEPYLGEIKLVAQNYAPRGWALCSGQLLPINQNQALFSLLGTTYGGNGQTTFALPDLRGRVPVGDGLSIVLGERQGAETAILTQANLPAHSHNEPIKVSSSAATANVPTASSSIAAPTITVNSITRNTLGFNTASANTPLIGTATTSAGTLTPTPINTMQPSIAMTYIIALQGIFPSRN
ncbi:MAG: phage tail protein [Flavobacterium sp.]|nr:phage tail protein [Flavobacterium sp.]